MGPSERIDQQIAELADWRGQLIARLRALIHEADPDITEESDLPTTLSAPAQRALAGAGIERLEQLTRVSEAAVKKLHGIGPNALTQLRNALAAKGLSFADGKGKKLNVHLNIPLKC